MLDMSIKCDVMNDIGDCESNRLFVYDDATGLPITKGYTVLGHPTIGQGRCLDLHGISAYESKVLLDNDVTATMTWCSYNLPFYDILSPVRQRVICNMVYQIGQAGFLKFADFITAINNARWEIASDEMLNSLWARKQSPSRATMLARWFKEDKIC
jgi:lysozyme